MRVCKTLLNSRIYMHPVEDILHAEASHAALKRVIRVKDCEEGRNEEQIKPRQLNHNPQLAQSA